MSRQFIDITMPAETATPVVRGKFRRSTKQKDAGGDRMLCRPPEVRVASAAAMEGLDPERRERSRKTLEPRRIAWVNLDGEPE